MVSADAAKELQNVLPKCNPFCPYVEYTGYQSAIPYCSLALLLWAISRVSLRTLLMWVGVRGFRVP